MTTMTDGSVDDGNYLVLVRAQVMTRDDSSGGWVPMGGGGLSYVSVRKRLIFGTTPAPTTTTEEESKHEYLICGKRITDQIVVLSCTIKKDFEYNKVMPTFHHWRTGDKKFGLTFQTAADARAFDKGVRIAVEDLLEGSLDTTLINDTDVVDDDVFMAIDLPVERGDSQSSSGSSGCGGGGGGGGGVVLVGGGGGSSGIGVGGIEMFQSSFTHPHANHHHFHRMHYISRLSQQQQRSPTSNNNNNGVNSGIVFPVEQRTTEDVWVRHEDKLQAKDKNDGGGGGSGGHHPHFKDSDKIEILSEPYSYVQFARDSPSVHEYSYPMVDAVKGGVASVVDARRDNNLLEGGPKKLKGDPVSVQPPLLPTKSKWKRDKKREKLKHLLHERSRCKHCHEMFNDEDNERGSCEYAPDGMRSCINAVTCLSCAQCMLYHCMSDAEGDFAHHPCSCDRTDEHCSQRWIGLTILSFFVPCLWCYLPMSTCHRCGIGYGLCGGRHEAT